MTNSDFYEIFGNISVVFATWDALTTILILRIVKDDFELPTDFDRMTLPRKLDFLKSLDDSKVQHPQFLVRIRDCVDLTLEVAKNRNRYIHDQWVFDPGNIEKGEIERIEMAVVRSFDGGRTLKFHPTHFKISELVEFKDQLLKRFSIFAILVKEIDAATGT